ncbi:Hypothetical_protein [Hexamita inflata]|uniref:Hypothetical_protein n=1 Tax=Hexamita inflata TaxID=28002 RepID=A0ABP1HLE4_9EUKA
MNNTQRSHHSNSSQFGAALTPQKYEQTGRISRDIEAQGYRNYEPKQGYTSPSFQQSVSQKTLYPNSRSNMDQNSGATHSSVPVFFNSAPIQDPIQNTRYETLPDSLIHSHQNQIYSHCPQCGFDLQQPLQQQNIYQNQQQQPQHNIHYQEPEQLPPLQTSTIPLQNRVPSQFSIYLQKSNKSPVKPLAETEFEYLRSDIEKTNDKLAYVYQNCKQAKFTSQQFSFILKQIPEDDRFNVLIEFKDQIHALSDNVDLICSNLRVKSQINQFKKMIQ